MKNIMTHGLTAVTGYFIGKKIGDSNEKSRAFRTKLIPSIILAYTIVQVATTLPPKALELFDKNGEREYKLKDKALDKNINIFDDKKPEFDKLNEELNRYKKEFDTYKESVEKKNDYAYNLNMQQTNRLNTIDSKVQNTQNDIYRDINSNSVNRKSDDYNIIASRDNSKTNILSSSRTYITFDKSDQKFYVMKGNNVLFSGHMIYNSSGKPINKIYNVKEIKNMTGKLYPGFVKLDGVIGISGAGQNNEFHSDIINARNSTLSGFRLANDDMRQLMSYLNIGTEVEVRN